MSLLLILSGAATDVNTNNHSVVEWMRNAKEPFLNVKELGCKGDGIKDDAPCINNAISALGAKGGTVYFPPGIYSVGSTINLELFDEEKYLRQLPEDEQASRKNNYSYYGQSAFNFMTISLDESQGDLYQEIKKRILHSQGLRTLDETRSANTSLQ